MDIVSEFQLSQHLASLPWPEPRVVAGGNFATPRRLLEMFDSSAACYRIFVLNAQSEIPERPGVVAETPFVGPGMRNHSALDYLPTRLSLVPRLFDGTKPPDVVLLNTSLPRNGKVSLGIEVNILPAAIERTRARGGLVIAQLNPRMPYTFGDAELELSSIDQAIEVDEPLASPVPRQASATTDAIAGNVAGLVAAGSTLQVGIGELPDAVLRFLISRRDLGMWTEVVSDGVLALERAGALAADRLISTSFMFGSAELYSWVDANPRVQLLRTETINDPTNIANQPAMCSINSALQVDLYAQANASYIHGRIYSGFGGQPDFVVGALHSAGGQAIIALPSWHAKSDTSNIVAQLADPVTSFQHSAVVTDQGCAAVFGNSRRTQVRLLIEHAAHPRARAQLYEAARQLVIAGRPTA
jgi:acyl-CoA hydrolase